MSKETQKPKVIKREMRDCRPSAEDNQKRHELGLLRILAEKYPSEIKSLCEKLELKTI
jgi:hypothetical protein